MSDEMSETEESAMVEERDEIDMGNAQCPACGKPVSACGGKCLPNEDPEYPLHDRLKAREPERLGMQKFFDWLQDNGYCICKYEEVEGTSERYWPTDKRPDELIGGAIGVCPKELEKEKQKMLDSIRA